MSTPAPRDLHEPVPGQIDLVELLEAAAAQAHQQHAPGSEPAAPQT